MLENQVTGRVVDLCVKIHKLYGPGMLETVYEELLSYELAKTGISFERQKPIPLMHDGVRMDVVFRADLVVENKVIVELKSVEFVAPVHFKQVLTYLKLTKLRLGLLVNFNAALMKDGIFRLVNGFEETVSSNEIL